MCDGLNVAGNWVYYNNSTGLYKIGIDGQGQAKLTDFGVKHINIVGGLILCRNYFDDKKSYEIKID